MTAIVDLVFTPPPRSRRGQAVFVAVAVHAALLYAALGVQITLEAWSADLAARIHADLSRVEVLDIPTPPPPTETPPPPPPEPTPQIADATPPAPAAPSPRVRVKVSNPPAHAGKLITASPDALDMTGDVIVQGTASGYAGGVTSSTGTGTAPGGSGSPAPPIQPPPKPAPPPPGKDLSRPVALPSDEWSCPWPAEALDLAIDEQTAEVRVTVGPDGSVESSRIVRDPGDGFGAAALACIRGERLIPAHDSAGKPVRATVTTRLRFYR